MRAHTDAAAPSRASDCGHGSNSTVALLQALGFIITGWPGEAQTRQGDPVTVSSCLRPAAATPAPNTCVSATRRARDFARCEYIEKGREKSFPLFAYCSRRRSENECACTATRVGVAVSLCVTSRSLRRPKAWVALSAVQAGASCGADWLGRSNTTQADDPAHSLFGRSCRGLRQPAFFGFPRAACPRHD